MILIHASSVVSKNGHNKATIKLRCKKRDKLLNQVTYTTNDKIYRRIPFLNNTSVRIVHKLYFIYIFLNCHR